MTMRNFTKYLKATFVAGCFIFGVAQCGSKESNSGKIKFKLIPDNPVVVTADLTLNPGTDFERTVNAPWFLSYSSLTNSSQNTLYLVTLEYEITGNDRGVRKEAKAAIDPTSACTADPNPRVFMAILSPGQVYEGVTNQCNPTTATTAAIAGNFEGWYIDNLPEMDNPQYSVEVTGAGWFVDAQGIPIERLTISSYLSTQ